MLNSRPHRCRLCILQLLSLYASSFRLQRCHMTRFPTVWRQSTHLSWFNKLGHGSRSSSSSSSSSRANLFSFPTT
ncbi:unnamed protein product [Calicophoron daubneyi]|uniref:Secreted protein n=1 Tax=Calicophoron daubneyi TaxID=300641 RepID=A0AAV2T8D0_CALDB